MRRQGEQACAGGGRHHLLHDFARGARERAAVDVGEVQRAVVEVVDAGSPTCTNVGPKLKHNMSFVRTVARLADHAKRDLPRQ